MRSAICIGLSIFAALGLGGCSNTPTPHYLGDEINPPSFTVADLMKHIRCEVERAPRLGDLAANGYVAQVTLTLKVEDNGGISPNLSFLDAGTNFTGLVNGNFNIARAQTFTTSYSLDTQKLVEDLTNKHTSDCGDKPQEQQYNLTGDLGMGRILEAGLPSNDERAFNIAFPEEKPDPAKSVDVKVIVDPSKPPNQAPNVEVQVDGKKVVPVPSPVTPEPKKPEPVRTMPTFGSNIQFALVRSIDAGPRWELKGFKGPSAGGKGLFNGGRTNTDTLIVAFAPPPKPPAKPDALRLFNDVIRNLNRLLALPPLTRNETETNGVKTEAVQRLNQFATTDAEKAAAAATAQSFTTNIILQNLTSGLPGK